MGINAEKIAGILYDEIGIEHGGIVGITEAAEKIASLFCRWCGQTPIREVLDGEALCQSCCGKWVQGERP